MGERKKCKQAHGEDNGSSGYLELKGNARRLRKKSLRTL